MEKQKLRSEISDEYKWDLKPIYKSDEDWYKDLEKAKEEIKKVENYKNFLDSASNLLSYLKYDVEIDRLLNRLYSYAHLNYDTDTTNTKYQEMTTLITDIMSKYNELSSFVVPMFISKDYSLIEQYMKELPELKEYEYNLKDVYRYQKHTLDEKTEKIISTLMSPLFSSAKIYSVLTNSDFIYGTILDENNKEVELTDSNYVSYLKSENREVRKRAFNLMHDKHAEFKNTIAATYIGDINTHVALAKIRNFDSALEHSLYSDNVSPKIYDNLINTVSNNLKPLYDYYELKRKVLNLDEFHLYDVYTHMIEPKELKTFTFDEAKNTVIEALNVLGDDYINNLKKAFTEKWIDVYNNKGKTGGAYSSGFYDIYPYVLLNFEGTLNDVSTLAHELGHSMHSYYSWHNNSYQNSEYQIFVAEVASTVNELLLAKYLLNKLDNKESKLYILNQLLDLFKGTVYRQTMFAEFERNIYQKREDKEPLTHEIISDEYYKLNKKYFGDNVVVDDKIKYEWERIPHFYYGFYVYKYATGLSAACHIVERILNNKENALDNYLAFLKTGGSMDPVDELKIAGVDIEKPEVIESAINMFNDILNETKELLGSE